jgi:hypothetical protein
VNLPTHDVQLVTHCYAAKLSQYAEHLRLQMGMLEAWPGPPVSVALTVYYTPDDANTAEVISLARRAEPKQFTLDARPRNRTQLFRRAILRNEAASNPLGRIVWYTDVDYAISRDACEAASQGDSYGCYTAAGYWISTTHAEGDLMTEAIANSDTAWPLPDTSLYAWRRNKIAIGGLQIIGCDRLREIGYLRGQRRWMRPANPRKGFLRCKCDKAWRHENQLTFERLELPHIYRTRHSLDGRNAG